MTFSVMPPFLGAALLWCRPSLVPPETSALRSVTALQPSAFTAHCVRLPRTEGTRPPSPARRPPAAAAARPCLRPAGPRRSLAPPPTALPCATLTATLLVFADRPSAEKQAEEEEENALTSRVRALAVEAGGSVRAVEPAFDGFAASAAPEAAAAGLLVTLDGVGTARAVLDRLTAEGRNAFFAEVREQSPQSAFLLPSGAVARCGGLVPRKHVRAGAGEEVGATGDDRHSASSRSSSRMSTCSLTWSEGSSHCSSDADAGADQDSVHLRVPENRTLWLVSPPGSPPVGWTSTREHPPNASTFSDDLYEALRELERMAEFSLDEGGGDEADREATPGGLGAQPGQQFPPPRSPAPQRSIPASTAFSTGSDLHPVIVVEDCGSLSSLADTTITKILPLITTLAITTTAVDTVTARTLTVAATVDNVRGFRKPLDLLFTESGPNRTAFTSLAGTLADPALLANAVPECKAASKRRRGGRLLAVDGKPAASITNIYCPIDCY
ncbi:MAG: hypothetical protein BJ554DRAFT_3098 [Olpidium bornovanus]|uniref:Uncharacterized protein n=1 Tax=Olpidium bornovanus TaxID=278681 RepID=A0A8H7ZPE1_9FUNG|nr:MAG: hypothetical protein BJ554DRAFT_3098 [Olpidium bornovanus]